MREESKGQLFAHSYVDNETQMPEEKKLHVARTRESIPFGMNIRAAAYEAAYGKHMNNNILKMYVRKKSI